MLDHLEGTSCLGTTCLGDELTSFSIRGPVVGDKLSETSSWGLVARRRVVRGLIDQVPLVSGENRKLT